MFLIDIDIAITIITSPTNTANSVITAIKSSTYVNCKNTLFLTLNQWVEGSNPSGRTIILPP